MKKINKKATGERLEFYDFSNVTVEHLHRYAIAKDFVLGKTVLDIASGEGYGSYLLSETASQVIGVDIDLKTIEDAKRKYSKSNLKYLVGSADKIPVESNSIDIVVSFETLEHHDKHEEMFLEIKRILKQDGILIMSTPDKKYYTDLTGQINPYHVKELYFDEFESLILNYFIHAKFYVQKAYNLNSIILKLKDFNNVTVYTGNQNKVYALKKNYVYVLTIASNLEVLDKASSIFDGTDINKIILDHEIKINTSKIKNSKSYLLGNFFMKPLFNFKKKLNNFISIK